MEAIGQIKDQSHSWENKRKITELVVMLDARTECQSKTETEYLNQSGMRGSFL